MNNFSAFKLFYEEFIYKKNIMVDYNLIEKNIENIKKILFDINDSYMDNKDLYLKKIEKSNKSIKKELDNIMNIYPYFFELYYVLYKRNVENFNEVKDMPLVISLSFYNDFQEMNKSYISRFTSKEKRQFRNDAKKLGFIGFFIEVLKNRNKEYLNLLIDELVEFTNKDINVKSSFEEVRNSFDVLYKSINNQLKRCVYNSKLNDDYVIVRDIMEIAFKDRINSIEEFNAKMDEYLLTKYQSMISSENNILNNLYYNYLSFKEFKKIIKEEKKQKFKYDEEFKANGVINYEDSLYLNDIRRTIITSYYDRRQLNSKQFNSLSHDLAEWIFVYKKFKAMYSSNYKRDNILKYALLNNIYELYNPYDLYNGNVLDKYRKGIEKDIKDKCRDFFINNYMDNIVSKTELYDTREYDMSVILDMFNTKELVDIFNSIKPSSDIYDSTVLLFANCIAKSIGNDKPSEENLSAIAFKYINARLGVIDSNYDDDLEKYNVLYESYLNNSNFEKLKRGL